MKSFEQVITRAWYRKGLSWVWLLLPLSLIFSMLRALRAWYLKKFVQQSIETPVIIVGNISVGGTGKTPLIIALCEYAKAKGLRPGIVSRGYGSRAPYYPFVVTPYTNIIESGDEALLCALRCDIPVVISPDRLQGAKHLEALGCGIIFSDDGLQHYKLGRELEIVVVDAERQFGNGLPLPAGPLRESISRLALVDAVVYNASNGGYQSPNMPQEKSVVMRVEPLHIYNLKTGMQYNAGTNVTKFHAVTGLGNPDRFFGSLSHLGINYSSHIFNDHHAFTESDFETFGEEPVIMTEKDAVKCRAFAKDNWFVLRVDAKFSALDLIKLQGLIDRAASKMSR